MAGLLDKFGGDPEQRGLLAGAAALMRASGPSRLPVPLGQAMGKALVAGQTAYLNAQRQPGARQWKSQSWPAPSQSQPAEAAPADEMMPREAQNDGIAPDASETPVQRFNKKHRSSKPVKAMGTSKDNSLAVKMLRVPRVFGGPGR